MQTGNDKRVLVLFCGGTLVMEKDDRGSLVTPELDRAIRNLMTMETRLGDRTIGSCELDASCRGCK